jgi:hypothetical protein
VSLLEVTGDQWSASGSSGYGGANNGLVEAGEEVTLRPTLLNAGTLNYLKLKSINPMGNIPLPNRAPIR